PVLDPDGEDAAVPRLQPQPRQGPPWRTGERLAGGQVEHALMAGTPETALVRPRDHRAGQVRALLSIRDEMISGDAPENDGGSGPRVLEHLRASHRQFVERCDLFFGQVLRRSAAKRKESDPDLSDDEGEARQAQQLGEVAAGAKVVRRPVDRELLPPGRLI